MKLKPMLEEYYEFRGWDKHGVPQAPRLKMLGLDKLPGFTMPEEKMQKVSRHNGRVHVTAGGVR